VNLIFHGSTGQYVTKYCTKSTQTDDREEFDRVMEQKDRILSKIPTSHGEETEAMRRLLLSSFAHQKANVIGAPMSAYLTRNDERFAFSHSTVWLPVRDIQTLLENGSVAGNNIMYNGKVPFYTCAALHYLTRPAELHDLCLFDYFCNYEVVRATTKNRDSLMRFDNTPYFTHPSYQILTDSFLQGVRKRDKQHLPKIFQHDFPDTAVFGGDILTSDIITDEMETYAALALTIFLPLLCREDIIKDESYVMKLRQEEAYILVQSNFLNNMYRTQNQIVSA
jgi:hypothetical protein